MPNDNKTQPVTSSQPPVVDDTPPVFFSEDAAPPALQQKPDVTTPSTDVVNPSPSTSSGSAAPSDDVVMPPVVTTIISPKKKFAGGKIIATILGLFLLIGGIGAGVYLTGQNQDIREKACSSGSDQSGYCQGQIARRAVYDDPNPPAPPVISTTSLNTVNGVVNNIATYDPNSTLPYKPGGYTQAEVLNTKANSGGEINKAGYYCPTGSCIQEWDTDVAGYYKAGVNGDKYYPISIINKNNNEPTVPDAPPPVITTTPTAMCQNIKSYSETWVLLTNGQLTQLSSGDKVNFCVTGTATENVFDKAKFTINSVAQAETTTVRPTSTDFCQLYTIPTATTTFNVTAQIHHATLGWK